MSNNQTKRKRSRSFNRNDPSSYLANNSTRGQFMLSSNPHYSQLTKKKQNNLRSRKTPQHREYNKGNMFHKAAIQIKDYDLLVKGKVYHIGYGNPGDHAYYDTGEFVTLDRGDAIFKNVSHLNPEGEKNDSVRTDRIRPIERQLDPKRYIYKLAIRPGRKSLPRDVMNLIGSFNHAPKKISKKDPE